MASQWPPSEAFSTGEQSLLAAPFGGGAPRSGKGGVVSNFGMLPFNEQHPLSQPVRAASSPLGEPSLLAAPAGGSAATAAKGVALVALSRYHPTNRTPSVRPFGLPAPPSGSRGIVRIRPGFHKGMSAYRETPLRLAKSRLTAVARLHGACGRTSQALWACQLPFQGR